MKIVSGLLPGQVLQRDKNNKGSANIVLKSQKKGVVYYTIKKDKKSLAKFKNIKAGELSSELEIQIEGIAVGGPFSIELQLKSGSKVIEDLSIEEFFVGDVWVLAGQSNMQGYGNLSGKPKAHPKVRAFYMNDEWKLADEPIMFLGESVDEVNNGYGCGSNRPSRKQIEKIKKESFKGVSPGIFFAIEMVKSSKVPQGLIGVAHGGTSMLQWSPKDKDKGGASLYGSMLRRYKKLGQSIAGVLWYQGESDANDSCLKVYHERMKELVEASREDFGLKNCPWFTVQIGRFQTEYNPQWNKMQEAQRLLPSIIPNLHVVPAVDLDLNDGIHVGYEGMEILGKRLARVARKTVYKEKGVKAELQLESVVVKNEPIEKGEFPEPHIEVSYKNVVGSLMSHGLPSGFTVTNSKGQDLPYIYKTRLKGNKVYMQVDVQEAVLKTFSLSYGYKNFDYCNITDAAGMGLPAMRTIKLSNDGYEFMTQFQCKKISDETDIEKLSIKKVNETGKSKAGWAKSSVGQALYNRIPDKILGNFGSYVFMTKMKSNEIKNVKFYFGADSSSMVIVNGKKVFIDTNLTNPTKVDERFFNVTLQKGENEVFVVFRYRDASDWGFCLRGE